MKKIFKVVLLIAACSINVNAQESTQSKGACCASTSIKDSKMTAITTASSCSTNCEAKSKSTEMACKLTPPELQERKATILTSLRKQVVEKKELPSGYAYRFEGSDKMVDELTDFIKTERECCDFFTFNLSVSGDKSEVWMELKGPEGAKEFIKAELDL